MAGFKVSRTDDGQARVTLENDHDESIAVNLFPREARAIAMALTSMAAHAERASDALFEREQAVPDSVVTLPGVSGEKR